MKKLAGRLAEEEIFSTVASFGLVAAFESCDVRTMESRTFSALQEIL